MKTNLLSMEPLPTVMKAYHILQQIEKQHHINLPLSKHSDVSALYSTKSSLYSSTQRTLAQKKDFKKKMGLVCVYCKKKGHSVDQCFKLVGVPGWYVTLKRNQPSSTSQAGNRLAA